MFLFFGLPKDITKESKYRIGSVVPSDFFSFRYFARMIVDTDFRNLISHTCGFCCHFWTELESSTFEIHIFKQACLHEFIARRFIGNIEPVEEIREDTEEQLSSEKITKV